MNYRFFQNNENLILLLLLFILLASGLIIRTRTPSVMLNIDELLIINVIQGMSERQDLNTNRNLVSTGLPEIFKYHKYGFSSYILSCYGLLRVFGLDFTLKNIRILNDIYFTIGFIFILLSARIMRSYVGKTQLNAKPVINKHLAILIPVAIITFLPGLVFDTWMARPETFLVMLASVITYIYLVAVKKIHIVLMCLLIGYGIATKVTFGIFIILLIPLLCLIDKYYYYLFLIIIPVSAGFIAGAPYVSTDIISHINGLLFAYSHYNSGHPPHSLIVNNSIHMLMKQYYFFLLTTGPVFLIPFISIISVDLHGETFGDDVLSIVRKKITFLSLICVTFSIYMCSRSIFFERNLHFIFPPVVICYLAVNYFLPKSFKMLLLVMTLIPLAYWNAVLFSINNDEKLSAARQRLNLDIENTIDISFPQQASMTLPEQHCGKVKLIDYSDEYSARYRNYLTDNGYAVTHIIKGPFWILPVSTLHTYLVSNYYYMERKCGPD